MTSVLLRPVTRNSRADKRAVLYDGHDRRAGVSALNRALRSRRSRRLVQRSLRSTAELWQ